MVMVWWCYLGIQVKAEGSWLIFRVYIHLSALDPWAFGGLPQSSGRENVILGLGLGAGVSAN